jgi:hypothetical protein
MLKLIILKFGISKPFCIFKTQMYLKNLITA